MSAQSIVIVGGGVIGLSVALRLLEAGAQATVIDASAQTPAASDAAAGMLAPTFEDRALYEFGQASLARWPAFAAQLEAATGIGVGFRRDGALGLAFDAAAAADFADARASIALRGGNARVLNRNRALRREPAISERVVAALWAPDDAQVDARLALVALRRAVKRAGGAFIDGVAAAVAARNGVVDRVRLAGGQEVSADAVVIAAGHSAPRIATDAPPPPVYPVKGEAFAVAAASGLLRSMVRAEDVYLCPKADDRIVIGATEIPGDATPGASAAAIDRLRLAAVAAVPAIADCPELGRWAGVRPGTPDGAPILGRDPRGPEGLWFALGCYRSGFLFAPETAERLTAAILGASPRALAPFRPDRF